MKDRIIFWRFLSDICSNIPSKHWRTLNYLGFKTSKVDSEVNFTEAYGDDKAVHINDAVLDYTDASSIILNSYGALVLCTEDLIFIDVDSVDSINMAEVEGVLSPYYTRVYKSKNGFRILTTYPRYYCVDGEFEEILEISRKLGCDQKYLNCLSTQKYARIRLTPKPWRYNGKDRVKVCSFVAEFGNKREATVAQKDLFRIHDFLCKTNLWFAKLA